VEGVPDVVVAIASPLHLTGIRSHPCVHSPVNNTVSAGEIRLRFSPPLEEFDLLKYQVAPADTMLPVRGFYQMKVCAKLV